MRHVGGSFQDGVLFGRNGVELNLEDELSSAGREHVTIWMSLDELHALAEVETQGWTTPAVIGGEGPMLPRIDARTGKVSALSRCKPDGGQTGRLHLRATRDFFDADTTDPRELEAWATATDKGLRRAGGKLSSTCGVSAVSVMRQRGSDSWATVDQLDFGRDAVHGGALSLTTLMPGETKPLPSRGLHTGPGGRAAVSPYPGIARRFDHAQPIWCIDIVSAYPWALCAALPVGETLQDGAPFDMNRDGVSSVTIDLNGCAPVVPVRVLTHRGIQTAWPTHGVFAPDASGFGSSWSHAALHAAVATGAKILSVHRTIAFSSARWCMPYSIALQNAERASTNKRARASLRRMGRAMWGKLAQGRTRTEWIEASNLEQLENDGRALHVKGRLGDWCEVVVRSDSYPRAVHPFAAVAVQDRVTVEAVAMSRRIVRAGGTMIYLDTDGLIYSGPDPREIADCGTRPGQWRIKPDHDVDWIAIAATKRYCFPGRVVGVPPADD